ncbi:MAG: methyltransferase domain-containing protein [Planctomycetota bacterium]
MSEINLSLRDRQDEWMDEPDLDPRLHHGALRGLSRVNRMSGVAGSLWKQMRPFIEHCSAEKVQILDVASGGGDVAIALKKRAQKAGAEVSITGCDISPVATQFASENAARQNVDVEFQCRDVLADALPGSFDIVYTSLFLHHLEEPSLLQILDSMKRVAKHRMILSDLIRSRFGYLLAAVGIRILTRNPVCHFDGPLSVRAALTIEEISEYCERVGLRILHRQKVWPERFLIVCEP